jgi:hypothetical protein
MVVVHRWIDVEFGMRFESIRTIYLSSQKKLYVLILFEGLFYEML